MIRSHRRGDCWCHGDGSALPGMSTPEMAAWCCGQGYISRQSDENVDIENRKLGGSGG